MKELVDNRITKDNNLFIGTCTCGTVVKSKYKNTISKMLNRGSCSSCKKDYRDIKEKGIYKNSAGKWCTTCSDCGEEQEYSRKDHAKNSYRSKTVCRKCAQKNNAYSINGHVGAKQRLYNKFSKSAQARGIEWKLTLEEMFSVYDKSCALTGWDLDIVYSNCNASLDRINSDKGYTLDNIQWVHSMVNISKNKYSQEDFVKMCTAVANKVKW